MSGIANADPIMDNNYMDMPLDEGFNEGAEQGSSEPKPLDLTSGGAVANTSFPSLAILDDRTASLFATELSHALQATVEVTPESSEVDKLVNFSNLLETPGCLNHVQFEGLGAHGMIAIDNNLVFAILERLFGGGNTQSNTPRPIRNRFSSIEQRVVRRIVHMFGRSMEAAWRNLLPLTVRHLRIETRAENIPIASPNDAVTHTTFRITIEDFSGSIRLAMPVSALDVHKKKLSGMGFGDEAHDDEEWQHNMAMRFTEVSVDLIAELGRAKITLGRILSLHIGDVIRLGQSPEEPISITLGGVTKFSANPTVQHGNLAVIINDIAQ